MFKAVRLCALLVRLKPLHLPQYRRLKVGAYVAVKKYVEAENDYAVAVLRNLRARTDAVELEPDGRSVNLDEVLPAAEQWCGNVPEKVLLLLRHVVARVQQDTSETATLEDTRFAGFINAFVRSVPQLTDEQLSQALGTLAVLEDIKSIYEPNYLALWTALDAECLARVADWNVDRLLHFADQWYPLRLVKQGKFVHKAIWKISNRLRKLPPEQLVRTVFYINLTRVPVENMMDIEVNFRQNFDAFTIDDVAVLCMGFFKTETPVRDGELLERIYRKVTEEVGSVEDIALTAILKLLRYSSRIPSVASMRTLLDTLVPEVPRLSVQACLHVALLGSDIHVCHRDTLEPIVERFLQDVPALRLKDAERIAFVLAHGNVTLRQGREMVLLRSILADLPNRVPEIVQYPRCYIALLQFLALRNVYDPALVSTAFDRKFLQLAYSRNIGGAGREAVSLDAYIAICLAGAGYTGNRFPPDAFRLVCKLTQDYLPNPQYKLTKSDRMLLDIQATFEAVVKEQRACQILHLLPHYQRPDILFCRDAATGRVVPLPELSNTHEIRTRESVLGQRSGDSRLRLVALVVGSWNCYIRDDKRRTGGYAMKLEQLRKLQYETLEIPWYEWPVYSRDDMRRYLEAKLATLLSKRAPSRGMG
uniref:RAP domain-containing protein n=1 Tax=Anopheles epiroticus TaxID=199890 RepID=A0A182PBJ0_9DIPT